MKRNHPDAIELPPIEALPAPAAKIVDLLSPMVTERRMSRIREVCARRTRSLIPVLEDLTDPHNGAAIMRSADAFGCHEVHIIEDRNPFLISHRVTRGTDRWLELHSHPNTEACLKHLSEKGYKIFVAAMDGTMGPEELAKVDKAAVVFGNEHLGASDTVRALADGLYRIPMEGFVESLNVSVASAITLHVGSRGRHGDLSEEEQVEIQARFLMSLVKDADRIVKTTLLTEEPLPTQS